MKDLCQYGNRPEDEWEILPWIPDPRPPFKIWVKPEQIAPFFLIPHHPYAIALLLKISDGFRTEEFRRLGLTGSSGDWGRLVRGVIQEFEENNSGVELFHFDSDEDVFCVYSQYIDDLILLSKMIRAACDNEKTMRIYLGMTKYIKLFRESAPAGEPTIILYEVDIGNERLALRSIDIFMDGHTRNIPDLYDGAIEITPIPTVEELNAHVWGEEFRACVIEKAEFEAIWENHTYAGALKESGGSPMSKTIKTKDLPLFSIIDIDQLRQENHLDNATLTDFSVAWNRNVYFLMEQTSGKQSKDWLRIPSIYTVVEIKVDWTGQRVLETSLFPIGPLKFQFHFLRSVGEHFLLLGARCEYWEDGPDKNAWIVSRDGVVLSRFCLGDGIQDCVVKKDGTIITSYFDEGVFGNYGWNEPLGACGLIAWTPEGVPLWKNEKFSIYDCYAISLDEEESLWFYYYDEFRLVRTNFKENLVFDLPIKGSGAFSIDPSGEIFLFQGGYQKHDKFYFLTRKGGSLGQKQEAIPNCDGSKITVECCSLLDRRMLFLGKNGVLYGGVLGKSEE